MTVAEASALERLLFHLTASRDRTALVSDARTYAFGDLDDASRRYAAGLVARGIEPGDRVAVFAENRPEVVVALLGHHRLGVIHVPLNPRYRAEEAGHVLGDSGARAVVVAPGSEAARVLAELGPVPGLELVIALGGIASGGGAPFDVVAFDDLLLSEPLAAHAAVRPRDGDTALLIYTSGTTGKSKGVELSYAAVVGGVAAVTGLWEMGPADRLALALPLFHVHGLCLGVHGMLLHGMPVVLFDRFDARRVAACLEQGEATVFMGVPTMYVRLLELLERRPSPGEAFRRARLFTSGSAPLPADDFRAFEAATGHRIVERYGMSETLFTLSNPYRGERRPGTVGLPVPGCEVRLVDDGGADVAGGELGEIAVRGPGLMTRYRGLPSETAASFRDGWFLTGDLARRDADGYVTLVGRKSVDVLKVDGFKVSAREIEDVLRRHPLVADVAVVGAPDRLHGQRIVAAVVLGDGSSPEPEALLADLSAFASRALADFKRPRAVVVVPELPRNAMGKVLKHRIPLG